MVQRPAWGLPGECLAGGTRSPSLGPCQLLDAQAPGYLLPQQGNSELCLCRAASCPIFGAGWGARTLQAAPSTPPSLSFALQLEYVGASTVQLRFLRLHSRLAAQKVSYSCSPAPERGQPQPEKEILFLADSREQSYTATLQGCLVSRGLEPGRSTRLCVHCVPRARSRAPGWARWAGMGEHPREAAPGWENGVVCGRGTWSQRRPPSFQLDNESSITDTIFQFTTEELSLLPLRDLAVFHNGDASHQFGFTVGPVCFS